MMQTILAYRSAPDAHLRHLVFIRFLVICGLWLAIAGNFLFFQLPLATAPVVITLVALTLINVLTWLRINKSLPVTDIELFIQLLLDVCCLSVLLYYSGGANNPLISYLLVPICLAAATLTTRLVWFVTILCLSIYTLLLFFHVEQPLLSPHQHHSHDTSTLNFHILGMWAIFSVSALLISYFVNRMANNLRTQSDWLKQRNEEEMRDEQLMAVATLAAGTAHELGTPLSTIKLLLHEMQQDAENQALKDDLTILSMQVEQCSSILKQLVTKADQQFNGEVLAVPVREFCQSIIEQWKLMRPEVTSTLTWNAADNDVRAIFDPTIKQAILNLLHNAADANPGNVLVEIQWDTQNMRWQIDDDGPGIPQSLQEQLGKAFVTTKGKGLGIGFFLTNATVNRHGGEIKLFSRLPNGTRTELTVPLTGQHND